MKNIFFRDGILIYYGNPAGYLSEGKVVLDSIFDKEEIIAFLSEKEKLAVEIRSGVYDRLSEGGGMEMTVEASKGRRIRIYQLKQDSPFMMRFISLAEREKRGFEKPQQKEYALVYEGEVDTFSLEDVWEKFGRRVPRDFEGHALSISDVVEFSEEEVSRYFYVEPKGFAEIPEEFRKCSIMPVNTRERRRKRVCPEMQLHRIITQRTWNSTYLLR